MEDFANETRDNGRMDESKVYYSEAFELCGGLKLKSVGSVKFKKGADLAEKVKCWLAHYETWLLFGEKCAVSSDHVLACDYYERAITCAERVNEKAGEMVVAGRVISKIYFSLAKAQMRSGLEENAKGSLDGAARFDSSSGQIQAFLDSWLSTNSFFESDLSLPVGEMLGTLPATEVSVFGDEFGGHEDDESERNIARMTEEEKVDEAFAAVVDGQIVAPLWGRQYGVGVLGVSGLDGFKVKGLSRSRGSATATKEKGLEEGIVNFVKDVGLAVGPAYENLRHRELLGLLERELLSLRSKRELAKEGCVGGMLARLENTLRDGVLRAETVNVYQVVRVRYDEEEKKRRKSFDKKYFVDTNLTQRDEEEGGGDGKWTGAGFKLGFGFGFG